jgi:protein gp37
MSIKRSNIGYCDFSSGDLGIVLGCTPASDGCLNCYARAITERTGRRFDVIQTYPAKLRRLATHQFQEHGAPFRRGPGSRPLAFVCDMADLFHPAVPEEFILDVFDTLVGRPDVDWLLLTKRAEHMQDMTCYWSDLHGRELPAHLWFGVTVEARRYAGRIYRLLEAPVQRRWVSHEPALEALPSELVHGLDWWVTGAESGPRRRPFKVEWALAMRDACAAAGIPWFGKQDSALRPSRSLLIDGVEVHQFPA